jgi:hypothetical protein
MNKQQTAVDWLGLYIKGITTLNCDDIIAQAKEMEKNSYICSKCKSQINGNEVVQQMQDSEKSD